MVFPFAAALMGLGAAGGLASQFGSPSKMEGSGRLRRITKAQMQAAADARSYFEAAGDVTNPLFRQTAAIEESRLRRSIAEGLQTSMLASRKTRARGLTAGLRPEREDEGLNLAMAKAYQSASEQAGGLASARLSATGRNLLGVSQAYGNTMGSATELSQIESANAAAPWQRIGQAGNLLSLIGMGMGGGTQLNTLFGGSRAASGGGLPFGALQAPSFISQMSQGGPQFSWRGP